MNRKVLCSHIETLPSLRLKVQCLLTCSFYFKKATFVRLPLSLHAVKTSPTAPAISVHTRACTAEGSVGRTGTAAGSGCHILASAQQLSVPAPEGLVCAPLHAVAPVKGSARAGFLASGKRGGTARLSVCRNTNSESLK